MFKDLDELVFLIFTKFAHWFQRLTGRTNYFLAKVGILVVLASITITITSYAAPMVPEEEKPPLLIVFLLVYVGVMDIWRMTQLDVAERDLLNSKSSAPAKRQLFKDELGSRVFWIFACMGTAYLNIKIPAPFTFWRFGESMFPFGVLIFRYFVDVDPLPPGKSKVKEFFEAITAYLSPAKTAPSEAQK